MLALHRQLHSLPEPCREVFSMRAFGELSFRETGELFGKNANWACVVFYRTRGRIREGMKEAK